MKSYNSLLLVTFIEICDTDNLALLSDKEETAEDLVSAWQEITDRFNKDIQGQDAGALFAIVQESRGLHRLNAIKGCYALWYFDVTWCKAILKELGVNVSTREKLKSRILNEENQHKIRVKMNNPKPKEGEKTNWWDVVASLQRMTPPITIDAHIITIGQFASLIKQAKKNGRRKSNI